LIQYPSIVVYIVSMNYIIIANLLFFPIYALSQNNDGENKNNWILSPGYSYSIVSGETFSNFPSTGSIYFNPPIGFYIGPFYYDVSMVYGNFPGEHSRPKWKDIVTQTTVEPTRFNVPFLMLGGSLNFIDDFFTEGQIGILGKGFGFRGFIGKDIPVSSPDYKIKVGSELFLGNSLTSADNVSYIGTIFLRVDWFLNKIKFATSF